jgi:chromosome segregation ATPase
MSKALENMTKEQLQTLVLEQQKQIQIAEKKLEATAQENDQLEKQIQATEQEVHAAQKRIQDVEQNVLAVQKEIQVKEQEIQAISDEKEELLKKFQDMLQNFSSMKFELAQLKRLIYGSKR